MKNIRQSIEETIGKTPVVRLDRLARKLCAGAEIYVKLEFMNPLSSVKDRPALAMINDAEKSGRLAKGGVVIEPTSGNMGIGLAYICAHRGYRAVFTMPETMSEERKSLLKMLGAELKLTDGKLGMQGAIDEARRLTAATAGAFMPMQFDNPANPLAHYKTTAPEIYADTEGDIDAFVAGVGTGGTFTGVSKFLKEKLGVRGIYCVAVEPQASPVISGGKAGAHMIQGIGAGFVPNNLDVSLIDSVIQVSNEDAINAARLASFLDGIPCGISSGANIWAAAELSKRPEFAGKKILTIAASCAERYISTPLGIR